MRGVRSIRKGVALRTALSPADRPGSVTFRLNNGDRLSPVPFRWPQGLGPIIPRGVSPARRATH